MKRRPLFTDPGFWLLIGVNVYLVYHYYQHPEIFTTLIWLYWAQSVLLGIFNFFDMITTKRLIPLKNSEPNALEALTVQNPEVTVESKGEPGYSKSNIGMALFFAFHYGFFHIVYMVFIATMKRSGPFQWEFFKYFLIAFFVGQVITFIQHKIRQRTMSANMGAMFFIPYIRIVPMHLTILLPAFLGISNMGIFLILKSLADVIMYAVTRPGRNSKEVDATLMASQQTMNI